MNIRSAIAMSKFVSPDVIKRAQERESTIIKLCHLAGCNEEVVLAYEKYWPGTLDELRRFYARYGRWPKATPYQK